MKSIKTKKIQELNFLTKIIKITILRTKEITYIIACNRVLFIPIANVDTMFWQKEVPNNAKIIEYK